MADDHHASMLVLHHDRKASAEDFVDASNGTKGLPAAADTVIRVRRKVRMQARATMEITGRDVEDAELFLSFDLDAGGWTLDDSEDARCTPEQLQVLRTLRESVVPLTPSDIARRLGKERTAIQHLLGRMAGVGLVRREEGGKWASLSSLRHSASGASDTVTLVTRVQGAGGPPEGQEGKGTW